MGQRCTQSMMQGKSAGWHVAVKHMSAQAFAVICERARGSISSARRALRKAAIWKRFRIDLRRIY